MFNSLLYIIFDFNFSYSSQGIFRRLEGFNITNQRESYLPRYLGMSRGILNRPYVCLAHSSNSIMGHFVRCLCYYIILSDIKIIYSFDLTFDPLGKNPLFTFPKTELF